MAEKITNVYKQSQQTFTQEKGKLLFTMLEIKDRIKALRKKLGYTQTEFGTVAGVSKAAVSNWERGIAKPQRDAMINLQQKENASQHWILTGEGKMFNSYREGITASTPYSPEDIELLEKIQQLSSADRARLPAILAAFSTQPGKKRNG